MSHVGRILVIGALVAVAAPAWATKCPNIMLVLDQSGSMAEDPNGGSSTPSKWQLLQAAVKQLVTMYGDQVPFGMELFTSSGFDDTTCYNDTMINVEPGHGTAPQIISMITAAMPDSGTNTGEAIKRAAVDPAMHDTSRGEYIILVTDGDPNCNSGDINGDAAYTIMQIQAAAAANPSIHTFVVGFDGSGGVNPANLNNMAKAGMEPIMGCTGQTGNECYYSANNAQALSDAINKIINQVTGGEFGTTMCDDSCYSNGCPMGQICTTDEFNMTPHCVPDPCAGAQCAPNEFCRQGSCVAACTTPCKTGETCVDGSCVADPCYNVTCAGTQVCNPQTGQCIDNPCINTMCKSPLICDVATGTCIDDPCRTIVCPQGTTCHTGGNCAAGGTADGGTGGTRGGRQGVGCDIGGTSSAAALLASLLALFGLGLVARRRRT